MFTAPGFLEKAIRRTENQNCVGRPHLDCIEDLA